MSSPFVPLPSEFSGTPARQGEDRLALLDAVDVGASGMVDHHCAGTALATIQRVAGIGEGRDFRQS